MNTVLAHVTELLRQHKMMITTAESCTAGLLSSLLTEFSGSSLWFDRGFVTYSNLSKIELLGVPDALLNTFGAVSEPVAIAMAQGALAKSQANISISITGIAGPTGGSVEKPVGTVWFGIVTHHHVSSYSAHFIGNRASIREQACQRALELIKTHLE